MAATSTQMKSTSFKIFRNRIRGTEDISEEEFTKGANINIKRSYVTSSKDEGT